MTAPFNIDIQADMLFAKVKHYLLTIMGRSSETLILMNL